MVIKKTLSGEGGRGRYGERQSLLRVRKNASNRNACERDARRKRDGVRTCISVAFSVKKRKHRFYKTKILCEKVAGKDEK